MLILTSAIVMGSPGPSTMSVTAVGAAFGLHKSLGYVSGLIIGTTVVLLAVATGALTLLQSVPGLAPALTYAAALYIAYLAFKIATAPPLSKQRDDANVPSFVPGFLLAVANPKAYLAIGAVFVSSTIARNSAIADVTIKMTVLVLMIVVIHFCWLLGGASLRGLLRDPVKARITNILFAVVLIGSTVLPLL
jgi:threonine/homoserine/homoserine lactone efflux protein